MLSVYTRHSEKCPYRDDIAWRRCRCPKWIQGTPSEDHEFLRTSLVRFETRREQAGIPAVTVRDLLKAALRHRPDRIIVGEVRGGEAFDLLQALNAGHSGSLCTLHANSGRQALARFADFVLQSGIELAHRAIMANIGNSVDLLVHIERVRGQRLVSEVLEVNGFNNERSECHLSSIFRANN